MATANRFDPLRPCLLGALILVGPMICASRADAQTQTQSLLLPHMLPQASFLPAGTNVEASDPESGSSQDIDTQQADGKSPETHSSRNVVSAFFHNLGDDIKHLPRRNSVYFLVGGGVAAWAVHPLDHSVNAHLAGSGFAGTFFAPGQYIGASPVQIGTSVLTYIVGRVSDKPRVRHIGMDLLEAQVLTEGIVELTKAAVRRPRPVNADGTTNATGYSFPSGHAAVTFATATVLQQHFGWRWAVPTYLLATYVATSRLHENVHYLSDVVFGATVGIIVGRSVTWHGRNTFTIAMAPLPGGIGTVITW